MFFVVVGVLVFGGGGAFLAYRACCAGKRGTGRDVELAGQDWTAAGAGDTFAFGDDLHLDGAGAGAGAGPALGIVGRMRLMMRRMRRGGVNEGIAMGKTMQFHTLEDF